MSKKSLIVRSLYDIEFKQCMLSCIVKEMENILFLCFYIVIEIFVDSLACF